MFHQKSHLRPSTLILVLAGLLTVALPAAALGPAIDPDGLRTPPPAPGVTLGGPAQEIVRMPVSP